MLLARVIIRELHMRSWTQLQPKLYPDSLNTTTGILDCVPRLTVHLASKELNVEIQSS